MSRDEVWFCEWPGELAHVVDDAGVRLCGRGYPMKVNGPNALSAAAGRCSNCVRMANRRRSLSRKDGAQRLSW